jgi:hypothetical protein
MKTWNEIDIQNNIKNTVIICDKAQSMLFNTNGFCFVFNIQNQELEEDYDKKHFHLIIFICINYVWVLGIIISWLQLLLSHSISVNKKKIAVNTATRTQVNNNCLQSTHTYDFAVTHLITKSGEILWITVFGIEENCFLCAIDFIIDNSWVCRRLFTISQCLKE